MSMQSLNQLYAFIYSNIINFKIGFQSDKRMDQRLMKTGSPYM